MTFDGGVRSDGRLDRTRERVISLNQLLLGAVVLLAVAIQVALGEASDQLFFAGVVLIFIATGAAIAAPWNRIPLYWSAIVPLMDIVAIGLLRFTSPTSGYALLWVFPATWMASMFGVPGLFIGCASVTALYWSTVIIAPEQGFTLTLILLPLTVIAVATTSFFTMRRSAAQHALLDKQARMLQRAVERARRQEDAVTDVLDAVDFGVIRISTTGRLSVTNEAHAKLQRPRGRVGEPSAYGPDGVTRLEPHELPLQRARRGQTFEGELVWYGDPGEDRRALSVTARRVIDADGADEGMLVVSRDVTSEELALRARADLVASVSHELRTPLTSIIGYIDVVLDDDSLSESARRRLEVADRNATRLLDLVSDILVVSSTSHSGVELTVTPEETDVSDVVRTGIEAVTQRANERRITIDGSGIEPSPAFADPHRVRQIVDNLLSNAVKYAGDAGHIEVGVTSDGVHAWIIVRDDGPGISEKELPQLFERFFRSASVRGSTIHGSGLGLAISRDLARAQGGEITVQSIVGGGSTFIVRLPARSPMKGHS